MRTLRSCILAALFSVVPFIEARAAIHSFFEMTETFSADIRPFPKWTGMLARFETEKTLNDDECGLQRYHPCTVKEWKSLFAKWHEKPFTEMIETVNDFANAFPYTVDQINWGLEDYWEAPYEFLAVSGDCEDYAISKYYSLRAAGIPASQMRVMIVQDFNLGGVIHAILGIYDADNTLYILDNQIKQVMPALRIYHYKPIYGINEEGWWAYYPK